MNELYHHGIKGQKWGVRRYQNKDGSLTEEGIKRLKLYKDDYYGETFRSGDKTDKKIDKGSELRREANTGESIDHRPKYVSTNFDDWSSYSEMATEGMLRTDWSKPISTYVYETKNELKIANGKKVLNDLLDVYGDKKIKTLFADAEKLGPLDYYQTKNGTWEREYIDNSNKERNKFLRDVMKENINDITEHYKKHGYDGIIDVEDWYAGVAKEPVIILNPEKSIKLKKELKW